MAFNPLRAMRVSSDSHQRQVGWSVHRFEFVGVQLLSKGRTRDWHLWNVRMKRGAPIFSRGKLCVSGKKCV